MHLNGPKHLHHAKICNCEECGSPICACLTLCDDCADIADHIYTNDDENIYGLGTIAQSIAEDRALRC